MPNSHITRSKSKKKLSQGRSTSENSDYAEACESESAVLESKMADVTLNLHPEMIIALIPVYDGMTIDNFLARVE